jgi:UDP-N-acetylmuramoyl-L-alanyl-D-glutamate--2,6-diaminopimelate ligase
MKLGRLLHDLDEKQFFGDEHYEISTVVSHSGRADTGSLFVAIPGLRVDGHNFLEAAYAAGARAFVTQRPFFKSDVSTIIVPDARYALGRIAAAWYGHPSQQTTLIGITGTNGKTSITYLLEGILKAAGASVGVLGTVAYRYGDHHEAASQTTLEPMELQKRLREMVDAGTQYVLMEVSSQGLDQRRVDGCQFDVGVFTNLTPEHLDYHKTIEQYYTSKERFFTEIIACSLKENVQTVINQDDSLGRRLLGRIAVPALSFGIGSGDIHTRSISGSLAGIQAEIATPRGTIAVRSPLLGTFNIYNILAAAGAALCLNIPVEAICRGISDVRCIPGRMERVENPQGLLVLVDYAHTGDALENVLQTLRDLGAPRIITVFGCGGDRDTEKRPVMGRIAGRYSTIVIITSDNPRSEDPEQIISAIETGACEAGLIRGSEHDHKEKIFYTYTDRLQAIEKALSLAGPGDVVLIAGKGHETTQQIGNRKFPFDDREVARQALARMCSTTGCTHETNCW